MHLGASCHINEQTINVIIIGNNIACVCIYIHLLSTSLFDPVKKKKRVREDGPVAALVVRRPLRSSVLQQTHGEEGPHPSRHPPQQQGARR